MTRVGTSAEIERGQAITITVDGHPVPAYAGETIAGALLAAAILLVRPRAATIPYAPAIVAGVWMAWLGQG